MIMKISIFILLLTLAASILKAQQLPEYSQYVLNPLVVNPGAAGSAEGIPLLLSSRHQWVGFENAPSTQVLSVQGLSSNYGLGGILVNDSWGNTRRMGLQLAYSYIIDINTDIKAGIGLGLSAFQYTIDQSSYKTYDLNDATLTGAKESSFLPNADFGFYMYSEQKWFGGVSVTHLLENKIKVTADESSSNKAVRHFFVMGGYTFPVSDVIEIQPALLLKTTAVSPMLAEINVRAIYDKNYWLGFAYRTAKEINILAGLKFKQFMFGYSFDYTTSDLSSFTSGTHEIVLGYNFGKKQSEAMVK